MMLSYVDEDQWYQGCLPVYDICTTVIVTGDNDRISTIAEHRKKKNSHFINYCIEKIK